MALRNKVREFRMKSLLAQGELAKKAGISQSTLCKIECGKASPSWETVYRIADALGCKVEDIFLPGNSDNSRINRRLQKKAP